jgi:hypothetical protein
VVPSDFSGDGPCAPLIQENDNLHHTNLPMLPFVTFIKSSSIELFNFGPSGICNVYFSAPDNIDFSTLGLNDNVGYVADGANFAPKVGECFKFLVILDIKFNDPDPPHDETIIYRHIGGCTNCFIRTAAADCYTSVITYSNDEDAFDFVYNFDTGSPAIHVQNKVELPFYLRDPVMNDDTKIYTRSDGSIIKLYERKEEQYLLETDMMPYTWLKALDIALSHDTVAIQNSNISAFDSVNTAANFQKKENFEIEYQKGPLTALGKGSCKLLNANPVHLYNNNCA